MTALPPTGSPPEEAVHFGDGGRLSGVLTLPAEGSPHRPCIVLLNAGMTHRIGPNRLYVRLARRLARTGHVVLRFDTSGVGDSPLRRDAVPYVEGLFGEVHAALEYLAASRGCARFVLGGICSGGATAFVGAQRDPRVVGVIVVNGHGHLHADHPELTGKIGRKVQIRHAWRIAFRSSFRRKSWRKLLTGRLDWRRLLVSPPAASPDGAEPPRSAPDPRRVVEELLRRGVRQLHVYSEGDEGLDYFRVMLGGAERDLVGQAGFQLRLLPGANHVFTQRWSQAALLDAVEEWMTGFPP